MFSCGRLIVFIYCLAVWCVVFSFVCILIVLLVWFAVWFVFIAVTLL